MWKGRYKRDDAGGREKEGYENEVDQDKKSIMEGHESNPITKDILSGMKGLKSLILQNIKGSE